MVPSYVSSRWGERGFSEEQARAYYEPDSASREAMQALEAGGLMKFDPQGNWVRLPAFRRGLEPVLHHLSHYQKIQLFETDGVTAIYLNETIQLEGREQHHDNEMMVGLPLSVLPDPRQVLILGGGFGVGAQLALQFPCVERVQVVEIDPDVVRLSRLTRRFRKINGKSLFDSRVQVYVGDAFDFLAENQDTYDLIVFDCDISATRQRQDLEPRFLLEFFGQLLGRLRPGGAFTTRIPIDDSYLELVEELGGDPEEEEVARTARLVRAVWPRAVVFEFLSLYCGRELYVLNFSGPSVPLRELASGSPTYRRVLASLESGQPKV